MNRILKGYIFVSTIVIICSLMFAFYASSFSEEALGMKELIVPLYEIGTFIYLLSYLMVILNIPYFVFKVIKNKLVIKTIEWFLLIISFLFLFLFLFKREFDWLFD